MKKKLVVLVGILAIVLGAWRFYTLQNEESIHSQSEQTVRTNIDTEKTLLVYFSHGGNTQTLAQEISEQLGVEALRIEPVNAYPDDDSIYDVTEEEQEEDVRPAMEDLGIDMDRYDTIFLGYPIWWYTYPQIILTFLDSYDLRDKTIVPFVSHGGSGMSGTEDAMRAYLEDQNVTVLDGLAVSREDIDQDQRDTVRRWLSELNLEEK